MAKPTLTKRCIAEFFGTFWLVMGGCGSAVLAAGFPYGNEANPLGIGLVGVSLAFGLTVLTMAYAVGHISGGHFNPAVSFGLFAAKRFPGSELLPYIVAQVVGAIAASAVLFLMASSQPEFALAGPTPFASNGFGAHSPAGYSLVGAIVTEFVMTFFFLLIILGSTDRLAASGFAPLAIGFALTLIHLISIPVTNTSVNPARSTGPALFAGIELISQLWVFWVFPILGAIVAGWLYYTVFETSPSVDVVEEVTVNR